MGILTTAEVQERCIHTKKRVSSFSNRVLVCVECYKLFNRYGAKKGKGLFSDAGLLVLRQV